jgi:hypothetical protein
VLKAHSRVDLAKTTILNQLPFAGSAGITDVKCRLLSPAITQPCAHLPQVCCPLLVSEDEDLPGVPLAAEPSIVWQGEAERSYSLHSRRSAGEYQGGYIHPAAIRISRGGKWLVLNRASAGATQPVSKSMRRAHLHADVTVSSTYLANRF